MACGPNVDQARPLAGAAALRIADLGWQGDPRRLPPTSDPRLAIALLGGALAGSGPGTSPYVGAVPGHRHGYLAPYLSKPCGRWWVSWTRWHRRADHSWCSEAGARRLERWDSNPPPPCFISRAPGHEGAPSCGLFLPVVTARVQPEPAVPMPCGPSTDQHHCATEPPVPSGRGHLRRSGPPRPGTGSADRARQG